ncbi:MAG: hypothetical protein K0R26_1985 [Bacteroidota bacterium]|jgi:hypothetical protein|nr:hypothetical protein [Bacteroidota bacterium]
MSKKAKTYLLIVIIILSWGYVGYKIYKALQGDDEKDLNLERPEIKKIVEINKKDSVILLLNYPDPFLKGGNFSKINNSGVHSSSPRTEKPVPVIKPAPVVSPQAFLDIKYVGLVRNNEKGTSTAMMTINGKSSFVKVNDVMEGYTILEVSPVTVKLKKGKELLIITK